MEILFTIGLFVKFRIPQMRKLLALALLSLALAGGVALVGVEQSTPARADCGSCS
jgi:multisubunit Na+/H+ antiporter MnhC subunit